MTSILKTILPRLDLLLRWLLACLLGFAVGLGLGELLTLGLSRFSWFNEDRGMSFALLICLGLALGFFQGLIMGDILPGKNRWLFATLGGFVLASLTLVIRLPVELPASSLLDDAVLLGMIGGVIGLAQWFVLRTRYRHPWQWIIANMIGYQAFLWMISHPSGNFWEFFMRGIMVGTLAAFIPGVTLAWLQDRLFDLAAAATS
jgi:hypothetical protein